MRICGIHVLAVLVAAVAVYAVGALIYGVLVGPEVWMEGAAITQQQMDLVGMSLLYGWVYGVAPFYGTMIDIAHLMIGHGVAGAILASWK